MNTSHPKKSRIFLENGQTLILIALAFLGLVAMAVLILDGGQTYMNRRAAQAAADSGALAGAYEMCLGLGEDEAIVTAKHYAVDQNEATSANAWIDVGQVIVEATIAQTSFLANIFGIDQVDVKATAAAGCFSPSVAEGVLPIAWFCREPIPDHYEGDPPVGQPPFDFSQCELSKSLHWPTELEPIVTGLDPATDAPIVGEWEISDGSTWPTGADFDLTQITYEGETATGNYLPQIFIIMDTADFGDDYSNFCAPAGLLDCDVNDDGVDDVISGGSRGWLNLDGGSGSAVELSKWVSGAWIPPEIGAHYWIPTTTGAIGSVFDASIEGKVLLFPVFNGICDGDPLDVGNEDCIAMAHQYYDLPPSELSDKRIAAASEDSTLYYHIAGFAQFYVSCVHRVGDQDTKCPFYRISEDNGITATKNQFAIEGYFVTGYTFSGGTGSGGVDLGVFILSLTR